MSLPLEVLEDLEQFEKKVAKLPRSQAKTCMEAEILNIRTDLRCIYDMEAKR